MANMVVRTNIFALNAHRNIKNVGAEQQRAANRLASGFRINSAADDAAGLAVSESMRAQIRGLDQASRNAQDGQALINTAEGGMQEIQNMLQRIRELTVQAANDTNTALNREQIGIEISQLMEEIDAMADRVEFNGMTLLNGDFAAGASSMAQSVLAFIREAQEALRLDDISGVTFDFDGQLDAPTLTYGDILTLAGMGRDLDLLTTAGVTIDATLVSAFLSSRGINIDAAGVSIITAGDHSDRSNTENLLDELVLLAGAFGGDLWFQTGANNDQGLRAFIMDMRLDGGSEVSLGTAMQEFRDGWYDLFHTAAPDQGNEISNFIEYVQAGIDFVSTARANLGAFSNRLDFTSRSLDISSENLSDAESRVRNTDMAREMMRFTMSNVLQQAAVSMLAQANQLPNNLLQLLR